MVAMSDKFQADPARAAAAVAKIEGLGRMINGMGERFIEGLSNSSEVLGYDEFGRAAGEQLNSQKLQLHQVVMALHQVAGAVPEMLKLQQKYVSLGQSKVLDSINDYSTYQGEGVPGKGSAHGK
jgi:hypothetical protein